MSKAMKKYRKKPVVIDAIQLTHNNVMELLETLPVETGLHRLDVVLAKDAPPNTPVEGPVWGMWIKTLEGKMIANFGDWIIKGVAGEFYPCKPSIFEATYERVLNEPA